MRRAFSLILVLGLAFTSLGERVEVERPWLSAYDAEGNLVWELRAAIIRGTAAGWVAEEAVAHLYGGGILQVTVHIPEVTADPKGLEWRTDREITGEGEGFSFTAEEARWAQGKLTLTELRFTSGKLVLVATRAFWESGGVWRLLGVRASFGEWELEFAEGIYDQTARTLEIPRGLTARGWGWEVVADGAKVDVDGEHVTLWGVRIGPA
ncbi:hypothetical protein ACVNPS_06495 [Candidatus Bipolaricaulota sp. J31]